MKETEKAVTTGGSSRMGFVPEEGKRSQGGEYQGCMEMLVVND